MLAEFIVLSLAHVIAVASPGADFAVVLKNTLRLGRNFGLATAVGVGLGILVHVAYTLLGVAIVLTNSPILFALIKYAGAAYLLWLAYLSFQSRPQKSDAGNQDPATTSVEPTSPASTSQLADKTPTTFACVKQGFIVNVLNPKVTLFFIALFTNVVSQTTPLLVQSLYGLWLSFYTFVWFAFVAWAFSRRRILNWYQAHGHWVDWSMGVYLLSMAIYLFSGLL